MDDLSPYVEPASRAQLVSKLRHLVRFSDLMLMLIGASGSGRSTVLNQLQGTDAQEERREVLLRFDETIDVTHLLTSLVEALDLDCPTGADNRARLSALHQYSQSLHAAGVPLVLLLDDADFLTNNALELLINFAMLEDSAPRVVLTGTPEFEQRVIANEFDQLLDGRLHVQLLEPFDSDEAEAFVQALLPPGSVLSAQQIRQLIDETDGQPGLLYRALQQLLQEGALTPRQTVRALPLPRPHLVAVALILVAIFVTSLWLYLPSSTPETEPASTRVVLPLDIPVPASEPVEQVINVREELQQRLQQQEQRLAATEVPLPKAVVPASDADRRPQVTQDADAAAEVAKVSPPEVVTTPESATPAAPAAPAAPEPTEVSSAAPAPAPAAAKPEVPAAAKPAPAVAQSTAAPAAKAAPTVPQATSNTPQPAVHPLSRADELLNWPDSGYTLQLLAARAEESVEQFLKAQSNPERFYYFKTTYKNAPWHVVVYGQFANRTAALNAVKTLPEELRKLRPWARSVAGVKSDIRK